MVGVFVFFFFKQKTAYEMRISDWSSDVCSSDLLAPIAIASALLLVIWVVFLNAFPQVGPRVGKTPADVWEYLFSGPKSADARSGIIDNLFITLRDAGVGFAVGLTAPLVVASIFVVSLTIDQPLMPVAMILRSFPPVPLTPIPSLI